jgi:integration host factor subunit alpha
MKGTDSCGAVYPSREPANEMWLGCGCLHLDRGFNPFSNTGARMTQKTVTRADLAEAVYGTVGLSRTESAELVERVLELIGDALIGGANVKLSSFGSFQVRSKNERIGRNPKTGEEVPILPRQVLVFKPSNVLKSKINKSMVRAGK